MVGTHLMRPIFFVSCKDANKLKVENGKLIFNFQFSAFNFQFSIRRIALGIGAASFWSVAEKDRAESPARSERPKKTTDYRQLSTGIYTLKH